MFAHWNGTGHRYIYRGQPLRKQEVLNVSLATGVTGDHAKLVTHTYIVSTVWLPGFLLTAYINSGKDLVLPVSLVCLAFYISVNRFDF